VPVCRCGRQIVFGKNPEGKFIPLDTVAPVYGDATPEEELESGTMKIVKLPNAYVSHFTVCKFANEFSRNKHKNTLNDKHL